VRLPLAILAHGEHAQVESRAGVSATAASPRDAPGSDELGKDAGCRAESSQGDVPVTLIQGSVASFERFAGVR